MLSQDSFMETLHEVAEIARTSQEPLTSEEIDSYFAGMELSDQQKSLIYNHISAVQSGDIDDEENVEDTTTSTEDEDAKMQAEESFLDLPYVKMYLEDIEGLDSLDDDALINEYNKLLAGDESAVGKITDKWLIKVVDIAKKYASMDINMEDVIQEGNIGLFTGLNSLLGCKKQCDVADYIEDSIKKAMELYIDDTLEDDTNENSVLGKIILVTEAKDALLKELGHEPTNEELSDYTKLDITEISDLMNLIKNKEE